MKGSAKAALAATSVIGAAVPLVILLAPVRICAAAPLFVLGVALSAAALKIGVPAIRRDERDGRETPAVMLFVIVAGAGFGAHALAALRLAADALVSRSPF